MWCTAACDALLSTVHHAWLHHNLLLRTPTTAQEQTVVTHMCNAWSRAVHHTCTRGVHVAQPACTHNTRLRMRFASSQARTASHTFTARSIAACTSQLRIAMPLAVLGCKPGYKYETATTSCISCTVGTYSSANRLGSGNTSCTACPGSSTTLVPGATRVSQCGKKLFFY